MGRSGRALARNQFQELGDQGILGPNLVSSGMWPENGPLFSLPIQSLVDHEALRPPTALGAATGERPGFGSFIVQRRREEVSRFHIYREQVREHKPRICGV